MAQTPDQAYLTSMASLLAQQSIKVRRDTGLTVLIGPIRLFVATAGTLLLFRVVLARSGLQVIGLWSMLNIVSALVSLMDVGFSQLLARGIHGADAGHKPAERLLDKHAAERAYGLLLWFVILPGSLLTGWLIPSIPYDRIRFTAVLAVIAWSAVIQLRGKLEEAVLAAYQDNAYVQVVNTIGSMVSLTVAVTGACLDLPLEGFALGTLLAAAFVLWTFQRRVASRGLSMPSREPTAGASRQRLIRFAREGSYFYSLSLGSILREPCFRIIIASLLGAQALGAYAIGFRASVVTRDSVAGGFTVLYPALASLHRLGNRKGVESMLAAAIIILVALGSAALGCLYGFAEPVLALVLGSLPTGVVMATRVLVIWNLITLFNVPFYYLLQATGNEKASAASLWVHTLAILLLWPLQGVLHVDLKWLLVYWTVTSLATQLIIFYFVQTRLQGFWPVLRLRQVRATLFLALVYWGTVVAWVPHVGEPVGSLRQFYGLALVLLPATAVFVATSFFVSRKTLAAYWEAR